MPDSMMPQMCYITFDADNAGRMMGQAILADDVDTLRNASVIITGGMEVISNWVENAGGEVIENGGDELTAALPMEALNNIGDLQSEFSTKTKLTFTAGVGQTLSQAGKSLMVGKFRGKNQIVNYDDSVEQEMAAVQEKVNNGTAEGEEKKIGDSYLSNGKKEAPEEKSEAHCQYCDEMDKAQTPADDDHCKYCHDMEKEEEPCKYCDESDAKEAQATGDIEGEADGEPGEEDCEYCTAMDENAGPLINNPTTQDSQNYEGQDLNPPVIDKPPVNPDPMGLNPEVPVAGTPQEKPANDDGNIYNEDNSTGEAMRAIAAEIDGTSSNTQEAPDVDDSQETAGGDIEDGTSRPEGFDSQTPGDMGLSEDEEQPDAPDLGQVLQEGLDNHSDNIRKEKVMQLVGEALDGFKASKEIFERSKEQAPQLYACSLAMLKAMIEMADMLGLGGQSNEGDLGSEQASDTPAPQDAAPKQAAPQGEKQPPKSEGSIGSPASKLSAKHTTKHVARTPMPPGAVNGKGQQKVVDPKTGETRWIDKKRGLVQSPTGVPVQPPKQGGNGEPKA